MHQLAARRRHPRSHVVGTNRRPPRTLAKLELLQDDRVFANAKRLVAERQQLENEDAESPNIAFCCEDALVSRLGRQPTQRQKIFAVQPAGGAIEAALGGSTLALPIVVARVEFARETKVG